MNAKQKSIVNFQITFTILSSTIKQWRDRWTSVNIIRDVTITNHKVKNYKLRSRNCHRCNCSHVSNIFQDNYPNSTGLSDTKIFQMQKYFVSQVWLPIIFNLHIKCILCPNKKIFLES